MARTNLPFRIASSLHSNLHKVGLGRSLMGVPVMILTTRGRKSGREVETPLTYFEDGKSIFVIASKGGDPAHPAWYLNLKSQPAVKARIGSDVKEFTADEVLDRPERDRLYAIAVSKMQGYAGYEKKTDRLIPVVRLEPR